MLQYFTPPLMLIHMNIIAVIYYKLSSIEVTGVTIQSISKKL